MSFSFCIQAMAFKIKGTSTMLLVSDP